MRDFAIVFVHLIVTLARLARPDGIRSVVAESVSVQHQLLILNRVSFRQRCVTTTNDPIPADDAQMPTSSYSLTALTARSRTSSRPAAIPAWVRDTGIVGSMPTPKSGEPSCFRTLMPVHVISNP